MARPPDETPGTFSGIDPERFVETVASLASDADKLKLRSQYYSSQFRRYGLSTEDVTDLVKHANWAGEQLRPMRSRLILAREIDKGPEAGQKGHYVYINEKDVGGRFPKSGRIPKNNDDPQANADWWATLAPRQRTAFAQEHPEKIGGLDGLPSPVRNKANRTVLRQKISELQKERDKLDEEIGWAGPIDRLSGKTSRLKKLESELKGMQLLKKRLGQGGKNGVPPMYLLNLKDEGTGRAVVSFGNPDTADNVSTYVPGTNTTLEGIGKDLDRAEIMQSKAREAGRPETAAAIMWFDYDAPQLTDPTVPVVREGRAKEAAPKLDSFINGLETAHLGEPSNSTVLGHSYGSTVAGKYLSGDKDTPVDNVIFVGSPGVGVDRAKDLNVDPSRVWAGKAKYDKVTWLPSPNPFKWGKKKPFGVDPASAEFGGNRFYVEDVGKDEKGNDDSKWGLAHSHYWDEDSKSLENITKITLGGTPTYETPDGPTPSPSPGRSPEPSPGEDPESEGNEPSPEPTPSERPGPTPTPSP